MQLLTSPEGNFLRFRPVIVDPSNEGHLKRALRPVNVRTAMVAAFYETHFAGVMTLEIDTRSMPNEDTGMPMVYHVRAKESEVRGHLGLKILSGVKGVTV